MTSTRTPATKRLRPNTEWESKAGAGLPQDGWQWLSRLFLEK
jgi:hypothetical protein